VIDLLSVLSELSSESSLDTHMTLEKEERESFVDHNNGKKRGLFVSMAEETSVKQKKKRETPVKKKYSWNMNLPISPFVISGNQAVEKEENGDNRKEKKNETENEDKIENEDLVLKGYDTEKACNVDLEEIKSKPHIKKWYSLIVETRSHPKYKSCYDMNRYKKVDLENGHSINEWVRTKPFSRSFEGNPQSITINCEMCETKDPVSGLVDSKSLCRLSIVNGSDKNDVLLNTLVKPIWPVIDYRTKINGIGKGYLDNVQFTLRHAQAFLLDLCSDETVIIGHGLYNDLVSLKLEHSIVIDTACLYRIKGGGHASPSLRDVTLCNLKMKLPPIHDSIEDAQITLSLAEHYRINEGKVKEVVKVGRKKRFNCKQTLLVHRIPKGCTENYIEEMFEKFTHVVPTLVDPIEFKNNDQGKSLVYFDSESYANLAFDTLFGKPELEKSGKLQKKVYLKSNSDYINVRKSVEE